MSSTEPPSRVPPRSSTPDTKAERDALSSKGRVEKVREVDADETRKRRFQKYYKDQDEADETAEEANRPSPYDLISGTSQKSGLGGVDDAVVPSPAYSPAPDVNGNIASPEPDEAKEGALPQSDDFWEDVDFPPDHPVPPRSFTETTKAKTEGKGEERGHVAPLTGQAKKEKEHGKKDLEESTPLHLKGKSPQEKLPHHAARTHGQNVSEKKKEPSPFGLPGKPEKRMDETNQTEKKTLKSPFLEEPSAPRARAMEKEEERYLSRPDYEKKKEKAKEKDFEYQGPLSMPKSPEEREGGGGGKREREHKIIEIQAPSLPTLPVEVQPIATAAATQAAHYLTPTTVSLFYQMVGTMYVMAGTRGVMRTEIVLNNPSFAASKFFGATIKIEKYATAPDSFNVTLTGSNQAVVAFKENIPSLLTAFQNGNFAFRVNRIDVEYTTEKPVFRRKEKGEERGDTDASGGDLGERRK